MFRNPTTDLLVVLVIVLLFFGPKRLPGLGRSLGSGIKEFKDSITGSSSHDEDEDEPPERPALSSSSTAPVTGNIPQAVEAERPEPARAPREQ